MKTHGTFFLLSLFFVSLLLMPSAQGAEPPELLPVSPPPIETPEPSPEPEGDVVYTQKELETWFLTHSMDGGSVQLGADLNWSGIFWHQMFAPYEVLTGPYTIRVASDSAFNVLGEGGGVFSGSGTVFHVEAGGSFELGPGDFIYAEGPDAVCLVLDAPDGLTSQYLTLSAQGKNAVALSAPNGLTLNSTLLSAEGAAAAAILSGGDVDLTYCQVLGRIDAPGEVVLDASAAQPEVPGATLITRTVTPQMLMSNPIKRTALNVPLVLPSETPCLLTAPGRADLWVQSGVSWDMTGVNLEEEGQYPFTGRLTPILSGVPGFPDTLSLTCWVLDPEQPRLVSAVLERDYLVLYFFREHLLENTLYLSADDGLTWRTPGEDEVEITQGGLRMLNPLSPGDSFLFYSEETQKDGRVLTSNVLKVTYSEDQKITAAPVDGDFDGSDRDDEETPPEPPFGWLPSPGQNTGNRIPEEDAPAPSVRPIRLKSLWLHLPFREPPFSSLRAKTQPSPPDAVSTPPAVMLEPASETAVVQAEPMQSPRPSPPMAQPTAPPAAPTPPAASFAGATERGLDDVIAPPPPSEQPSPPALAANEVSHRAFSLPVLLLAVFLFLLFSLLSLLLGIRLRAPASHPASKSAALTFTFCFCVTLSASLLFLFKIQFDNKYFAPGPQAEAGFLTLDGASLAQTPYFFLRDGWEFYQQQYLSPSQLPVTGAAPTGHLYLGQYGGFELGDPGGQAHGSGTYRLTIQTSADAGSAYAMDLPIIYGSYRLWLNGALIREVDENGWVDGPAFLDIEAQDGKIEIVVAVQSESGLYSGMVYPPAFGTPRAIWNLQFARILPAAVTCSMALLLAALYLPVGIRTGKRKLAFSFCFLCVGYAGSISRVFWSAAGLNSDQWLFFSRLCYYGTYLALLLILGQICRLPPRWRRSGALLGAGFCLWVLAFAVWGGGQGLTLTLFFSTTLRWYKYILAAYLLGAAIWAAGSHRLNAVSLLAGESIFLSALIWDRLYPQYEPILFQWPTETAVFMQLIIIACVLVSDTFRLYSNHLLLEQQRQSALLLAKAQTRQYHALAEHLEMFSAARHEMRSFLLSLKAKCSSDRFSQLEPAIDQYIGYTETERVFTTNRLVNALLATMYHEAAERDIQSEYQVSALPAALPIEEIDLCSILTNLLQNAHEACLKLSAGQVRSVTLTLRFTDNILYLKCRNPCAADTRFHRGSPISTKVEPGHGQGIPRVRDIIHKYGGLIDINCQNSAFEVIASIPCRRHYAVGL